MEIAFFINSVDCLGHGVVERVEKKVAISEAPKSKPTVSNFETNALDCKITDWCAFCRNLKYVKASDVGDDFSQNLIRLKSEWVG